MENFPENFPTFPETFQTIFRKIFHTKFSFRKIFQHTVWGYSAHTMSDKTYVWDGVSSWIQGYTSLFLNTNAVEMKYRDFLEGMNGKLQVSPKFLRFQLFLTSEHFNANLAFFRKIKLVNPCTKPTEVRTLRQTKFPKRGLQKAFEISSVGKYMKF